LALWKKFWLLFTVIWAVVCALSAGSILAFSDEPEKAVRPSVLAVAVPAALYVLLLIWQRLRRKPPQ
jgi:uncharacterized iron-regulated membrane protein